MTTTTERRTLPPVKCKPWCEEGDGHPDCVSLDDQMCVSAIRDILLSIEDRIGSDVEGYGVALGAMAFQRPDGTAEIELSWTRRLKANAAMMTPAEARSLATSILALCDDVAGVQR